MQNGNPWSRILIFSALQAAAVPILMMPYGFFFIPVFFFISFCFFFLPVVLVSGIMFFMNKKFASVWTIRGFGIGAALLFFLVTATYVRNDRTTAQYFGNHWMTYSQLVLTSILSYISWNYLAKNILYAPIEEQKTVLT